jgi:hypothetical protein
VLEEVQLNSGGGKERRMTSTHRQTHKKVKKEGDRVRDERQANPEEAIQQA